MVGWEGGGVIWYKSYDRTAASLHAERQRFHAASVFILFFHHTAAHLLNAVGTGTFFCFHGRIDLDGWFLFRRIDAKKFHCDPTMAIVNVTTVDNAAVPTAVATIVAAINTTVVVAVLTTAVTFVGIVVLYGHLDHCQWRGTASFGTAAAALADAAANANAAVTADVAAAAIAVATAETAVAAAAIAVATPEVTAAAIAVATAEAAAAATVGIGGNLNGRPHHGYTHCLRCQWLWRVLLATARTAGQLVQTEVRRV